MDFLRKAAGKFKLCVSFFALNYELGKQESRGGLGLTNTLNKAIIVLVFLTQGSAGEQAASRLSLAVPGGTAR